jgi:hypothetical protein
MELELRKFVMGLIFKQEQEYYRDKKNKSTEKIVSIIILKKV